MAYINKPTMPLGVHSRLFFFELADEDDDPAFQMNTVGLVYNTAIQSFSLVSGPSGGFVSSLTCVMLQSVASPSMRPSTESLERKTLLPPDCYRKGMMLRGARDINGNAHLAYVDRGNRLFTHVPKFNTFLGPDLVEESDGTYTCESNGISAMAPADYGSCGE